MYTPCTMKTRCALFALCTSHTLYTLSTLYTVKIVLCTLCTMYTLLQYTMYTKYSTLCTMSTMCVFVVNNVLLFCIHDIHFIQCFFIAWCLSQIGREFQDRLVCYGGKVEVQLCMYICIYRYVSVYTHMCIRLFMNTHTCTVYIYTYIYIERERDPYVYS